MRIYSETTFSFVAKAEKLFKQIIVEETNLKLRRTRFEYSGHTYPIHLVVFSAQDKLGYFDPHTYQIGLHQSLMYSVKDHVLKNILRHELAHYICFIRGFQDQTPHGHYFQDTCKQFHWDEAISKASLDIEKANEIEGDLASEKLMTKIKALLKLAKSDNTHEAELATLKANQLILKHNIKNLDQVDKIICVDNVLTYKQKSAKLSCIYDILKHFLVRPVFIYGQKQVSLEVSGSKENLELARYIANFLDQELENLWNKAGDLKGKKAKNSFFLGIARGYELKNQKMTDSFSSEEKHALIKIENELSSDLNKIYKRLSVSSTTRSRDANAFNQGKSVGKSLTINSAIKNKTKTLLLNWRT